MKKWNVTVEFTIRADNRIIAWDLSREICRGNLRDLATVMKITTKPLPECDAESTIAINDSIEEYKLT